MDEVAAQAREEAWMAFCYRSRDQFEMDEKAAFNAGWEAGLSAQPNNQLPVSTVEEEQ